MMALGVSAQDQLAVRINEKGILKVLGLAVKYNSQNKRFLLIPEKTYDFAIPVKKYAHHPVLSTMAEVSNLDLSKDVTLFLHTGPINISGSIDENSLHTQVIASTDSSFDLKVDLHIPQLKVSASRLSLYAEEVKTTISGLVINNKSNPIELSMTLRVILDGKNIGVKVLNVSSNLDEKNSSDLNIKFSKIIVPEIALSVNGHETKFDTSGLKDVILSHKEELSGRLLNFASEFIAHDLADMMNVYLVNKNIPNSVVILQKENDATLARFLKKPVKPSILALEYDPSAHNPVTLLLDSLTKLVHNVQMTLQVKGVATPDSKDLEIKGATSLTLNSKTMGLKNTIANSSRKLPALELNRNSDIVLGVSEPLLNGMLELAYQQGITDAIARQFVDVKGFKLKDPKIHFNNKGTVSAIINAQVDLNKVEPEYTQDWLRNLEAWGKNTLAAYLERNNNDAIIYFPIEIEIVPEFSQSNKTVSLSLFIKSPFDQKGMKNTFNYPTNVKQMNEDVRVGLMEVLKTKFDVFTNKSYAVDLSRFLNVSGVTFDPKSISIEQEAYLLLGVDIKDINFNSLQVLRK